jgi:hypothetical protein
MKRPVLRLSTLVLPLLLSVSPPVSAAERPLVKKEAERLEVRHSMIGPRDTLLFHTFADQRAVLLLQVSNTDASFPVSGKIHLFDPKTTKEGLEKWINNQHSDGLFPDVPEPVEILDLPEGSCKVTGKELVGEKPQGPMNKVFQDYRVKIAVKAHKVEGKVDLEAFEEEVGLFIEVKRG